MNVTEGVRLCCCWVSCGTRKTEPVEEIKENVPSEQGGSAVKVVVERADPARVSSIPELLKTKGERVFERSAYRGFQGYE